jgi:hypothetical protein
LNNIAGFLPDYPVSCPRENTTHSLFPSHLIPASQSGAFPLPEIIKTRVGCRKISCTVQYSPDPPAIRIKYEDPEAGVLTTELRSAQVHSTDDVPAIPYPEKRAGQRRSGSSNCRLEQFPFVRIHGHDPFLSCCRIPDPIVERGYLFPNIDDLPHSAAAHPTELAYKCHDMDNPDLRLCTERDKCDLFLRESMELFRDYLKTWEGIAGVKDIIDLTFFFAFGFFPVHSYPTSFRKVFKIAGEIILVGSGISSVLKHLGLQ